MNWEVIFDDQIQVVVLRYNGLINAQELFDSSYNAVQTTIKKDIHKVLVEARDYIPNSSISDIFKLPSDLYNSWGLNPAIRIAVIEPKDVTGKRIVSFWEYSSTKLGWSVKVLPNQKSAYKWLKEE